MNLFKNFFKFKNKIALLDKNREITFGSLIDSNKKFKNIVKKRSIFLLIIDNSIFTIEKYINIISNNHLAILVDSKANANNLDSLISSYKPNYIISNKNWFSDKKIGKIKVIEQHGEYIFVSTKYKPSRINGELSLLMPTSGTMTSLKYVKLTFKNLKFNSDKIKKYLNISSRDRAITSMQPSYSFMISIINSHLDNGASIYITNESLLQKNFWKEFVQRKISSFSGVPFMFELLLKIGIKKIFHKSLKTITQAGGNLDSKHKIKIINFCKKNRIKFFSMYGQTEASPRIAYLDWKFAKKKNGSIGKNLEDTKMWLENENNQKINEPFIDGEIVFKGKNIFKGYAYTNKDLKKLENTKKLYTGDIGYFDNEGFFYIKSRKSKIAKVYGLRFDLEELEKKLTKFKFNSICLNYRNQIIIFLKDKINEKKLLNLCSEITGQNERIFKIKKINDFPMTNSGKISYHDLRLSINDRI